MYMVSKIPDAEHRYYVVYVLCTPSAVACASLPTDRRNVLCTIEIKQDGHVKKIADLLPHLACSFEFFPHRLSLSSRAVCCVCFA